MTTDEQRARELAEQLALIVDTDYYGHHYFDDRIVDKLILPLIRDQGRYRCIRDAGSLLKLYVYDDPEDFTTGNWHYKPDAEFVDQWCDAAIDKARGET